RLPVSDQGLVDRASRDLRERASRTAAPMGLFLRRGIFRGGCRMARQGSAILRDLSRTVREIYLGIIQLFGKCLEIVHRVFRRRGGVHLGSRLNPAWRLARGRQALSID